ncbi:MAG: hypothetical protein ACOCVZ_04010 [Gemmatimonadota bacterium]
MRLLRAASSVLLVALASAACQEVGDGPEALRAPAETSASGDTAAGDTAVPSGSASPAHARPYAELRAEICDTIRNSFECARAIERRQIEAAGVVRRGDTLRLALAAGDTTRFVDEPGEHSSVVYYSYQNHWPDAGYFLLQQQYYEGSEFVLVDDSTGTRTRLPDWPLRAPDGRRFAVLSLDLEAGYGPNTLQIWSVGQDGPRREWETEPSHWGPAEGRWVDSVTLHFTQRGYCEQLGLDGRGMCDRPARVYREGGAWHLERGPAAGESGTGGSDPRESGAAGG